MQKPIYTFLAIFIFLSVQSQTTKEIADKKYEKFAYINAIKIYEKVANKGYKSADLYQKVANSYYFNGELEKANTWYGNLFSLKKTVDAEYYYRYSQTLKAVKNYKKSDEMLALFHEKNAADSRGKLYAENKNYREEINANSGRYTIENLEINSEYSDYGATVYGNKLLFSSARDTSGIMQRNHQWTGQAFTQLYSSKIKQDGALEKPEKFSNALNSKFNESTPVFTKDSATVYFTRNNFNKGKKGKSSKKTTLLKIYRATLKDKKWTNIVALPFAGENYSIAHPALSLDEKTLYFASDMPGSLGQSDLYKVAINNDRTFGKPENLGTKINTEGRETFPFITAENELYFASDGRPGLGGLDIFVSKIEGNSCSEPKNIGSPINSPKDDFCFFINTETRKGFFSSNRNGGNGNDDIYKFIETKKLDCDHIIKALITDYETGLPIANAKITLSNTSFKYLEIVTTNDKGEYDFTVNCNEKYYLKVISEGYIPTEKSIEINNFGETDFKISLEKSNRKISVGSDLAKELSLNVIYFDLDKANIREDAAVELAKILTVMNEYPNMKIEVRSHTDSRQSHHYNEILSDKRAKSTREWLIKDGIPPDKITAKGFGESQLLNNCSDGINCSEEQHQLNRRSEFIVLEF